MSLCHFQHSSQWPKGQVFSAVRSQQSIGLNKAMSSANTDKTHAHYGLLSALTGTAVTLWLPKLDFITVTFRFHTAADYYYYCCTCVGDEQRSYLLNCPLTSVEPVKPVSHAGETFTVTRNESHLLARRGKNEITFSGWELFSELWVGKIFLWSRKERNFQQAGPNSCENTI